MNKISFINVLPKAPDMNKPVYFDKDANNFVNALVSFSKELNSFIKDINTLSGSLVELNSNMISSVYSALDEIDNKTSINILNLENIYKELQYDLKIIVKKRLQDFTDELLQVIENKGYEFLERLNDNSTGVDYTAISQSLAHSLSLERFIMERGFIKLRKDDVNLNLKEQTIDTKLGGEILENITNIPLNEINSTLRGDNNVR